MNNFTPLIAEVAEVNRLKLLLTMDTEIIDVLSSLEVKHVNFIINNYEHVTGVLEVTFYSPITTNLLKIPLEFHNYEPVNYWIDRSLLNAKIRIFTKRDSLPKDVERKAIYRYFEEIMLKIYEFKKKERFTLAK